MKIILSESQIIELLKESYGNQKYIDDLLDKIKASGLSSLTPRERDDLEKMSRGEDIDDPEPENKNPYDAFGVDYHDMFMEMVPQIHHFKVGDEDWHFAKEAEPHGEFDILLVTNYKITFMINPFAEQKYFDIITNKGVFKVDVGGDAPDKPEQMEEFVQEFVRSDVIKIVQYVKKKL